MPFPDNINHDDLGLNALDTLREAKKCMEDMLASPGFKIMTDLINQVLAARINELLKPCASTEAVLEHEHRKGIYEGLRMAVQIPIHWLAIDLKAAIDARMEERDGR